MLSERTSDLHNMMDHGVSVYKQEIIVAMVIEARKDRNKSWPARRSYHQSIVIQNCWNNQGDFSGEVRDADNPRVSG
jgi:hypothetical protein